LKKAKELNNASIYTQRDILIKDKNVEVFYPDGELSPPPTLRIARGAIKWAKLLDIEELWIIAAEPHLWRCERDLRYAIKEKKAQIDVFVCEDTYRRYGDEWYCSESEQRHTRSPEDWWKREVKLKKMPMFIYKRVAK